MVITSGSRRALALWLHTAHGRDDGRVREGRQTCDPKTVRRRRYRPQPFVIGAPYNGFSALGPSQKSLKNPICKALGDRITRAIYDGKPFHVYMVLPVHPEGTLDTINIMTHSI
ncbi:hypothetical protein RALTA_B1037 [Cupriavidus taiwanensis LMG 19424]|uniref:Uncharacterized protein n=2 Tax=Cupriavidus taiwanensis TaxID=164546 RepID=B3R9S0_CUPTR|nr:hypothetical protein RALTA_B1037 [Cupriavidus taiwanensis LMG 19424]